MSNFLLVEAEDMSLTNYRVESGKNHASGNSLISLFGGDENEIGSASWEFSGVAGWYDLELGYFDETDGVSLLEVRVDDKTVATIKLDRQLRDTKDSTKTLVADPIIKGLALKPGQTISIVGAENVGEGARVDYLKLTSVDSLEDLKPEVNTPDNVKIVYPGSTIFQSNFNSGLDGWKLSSFDNPTSGIFANPDTNGQPGDSSVKFTLEDGDKREEINLSPVPYNSEITYHFSIFLPESYVADPASEIVAQWHALPDFSLGETWAGTGPVLSLLTEDGQWKVGQKWDSRQIIREKGQRGRLEAEGSASHNLGDYQTGVWTDWTFHVKWSYEADGLFEVWQNDNLVIRETGPNAYNDALGPYLKVGLYNKKWQNSELTKRELYYDDVKVLSVEEDSLLKGGTEDNLYVLNAQTASASRIQDNGGVDTLYFSDGLNVELATVDRQNNDLVLDIDRDNVFDLAEDLTISNFFSASQAGNGFIETVGNLNGNNILDVLASELV
ncbi:heparin lyase I family protein [Myxosarcina sp. GI1]|uniref:heparin lyase I family protein n=1 Tax=Myxosarcina sp. GI1 TaxID=1541065 RepID=UPI0006924B55|nr:heparin lyase I family protein [Myxosarcina sp. GI1]